MQVEIDFKSECMSGDTIRAVSSKSGSYVNGSGVIRQAQLSDHETHVTCIPWHTWPHSDITMAACHRLRQTRHADAVQGLDLWCLSLGAVPSRNAPFDVIGC